LDDPGDDIGGNPELVVENRCLIHISLAFLGSGAGYSRNQASSACWASAAAIFWCWRSTW
jgi:hypothetical protein